MDKKTFSNIALSLLNIYKKQYVEALEKKEEIRVEFICGILKGIEKLYEAACEVEYDSDKEVKGNSCVTKAVAGNVTNDTYDPIKIGYKTEEFMNKLSMYCDQRDCVNSCDPAAAKWLEDWNDFMADNIDTALTELTNEIMAYSDLDGED